MMAESAARTEALMQVPTGDRTFNTHNYLGGVDSDDEGLIPLEDAVEVKKGTLAVSVYALGFY